MFKWEHVKDAVTDYRCWLMVLQMFFSQAAGSVTTNFLGIIIKVSLYHYYHILPFSDLRLFFRASDILH